LTRFEVGFEVVEFGPWGGGDGAGAEEVDGVGFGGAFSAFFEGEGESAVVEAEPPVIGLVTSEASAVDAGLLAGS